MLIVYLRQAKVHKTKFMAMVLTFRGRVSSKISFVTRDTAVHILCLHFCKAWDGSICS